MSICGLGGSRCCLDGWWGLDYVGLEGLRKGGGSSGLVFGVGSVERCGGRFFLGPAQGCMDRTIII